MKFDINRKLLCAAGALALLFSSSFADDFTADDVWDDSADLGSFDDSFGDFGSFDDFGDFGSFGDESSAVSIDGSASLDTRCYVDADSADKAGVSAVPSAKLNFSYSGAKTDASISLNFTPDVLKNHPEDIVDELTVRGYFDDFKLEVGKMRVVWGKGDKLHVFDNFNADDYTDFVIPDYLERRVATPMIRGVYSLPFANMQLEAVYAPLLPTDRFATSGRWTPAQVTALTGAVTAVAEDDAHLAMYVANLEKARLAAATAQTLKTLGTSEAQTALATLVTEAAAAGKIAYTTEEVVAYCTAHSMDPTQQANQQAAAAAILGTKYAQYLQDELTSANTAYMLALSNANALSASPDVIYPDMMTLKYGQFGGRITGTAGPVDWGFSYYNGWFKQPVFNAQKLGTWMTKYLEGNDTEDDKFLVYNKKQTFALEAAAAVWHFNVRTELCYNLTKDTDGTDPWVHNNSLAWLAGFDIDLPLWNMNLNVQETGTFVLHGDECDKNTLDADYSKNGYCMNRLVANLSASFMNDKLLPEVTVIYGINSGDIVAMPSVSYKPADGLTLKASGMYIWCRNADSEFKAWEDNSFVAVSASYRF